MMLRGRSNYRLNTGGGENAAASSARAAAARIAADCLYVICAVAAVVAFFVLGKFLLETLRESSVLRLRTVVVETGGRLGEEEILRIGRVQKGMSIFDVSPAGTRELIERHPWVKQADVKRIFPDALKIVVRERVLAATALIADQLYRVDNDGEIFERHPDGEEIEAILITGIDEELARRSRQLAQEELRRIIQVASLYEKMGIGAYAPVGEIHREGRGELVIYTLEGAREIRLGRDRLLAKLKSLRTLLRHLSSKEVSWRYILIDSDAFPDRIVAKLE